MKRARFAAAAILTLGLLAPAGTATSAVAAPQVSSSQAPATDHHPNKGKKNGHHKFVLSGRVTSVGANTLTFVVHGGKRSLRGQPLTVNVAPSAKIHRNNDRTGLGAIQPTDHVNVKGIKDGGTYTATRISASKRH
jgi:hypothetical protein